MGKKWETIAGVLKYNTGIEGFDNITEGGLPLDRTTLLLGGTGCGKTILALQSLLFGAIHGEPGIFVAFEESSDDLRANAAGFDWPIEAFSEEKLAFLDARLSADVIQAGGFDLGGLLAMIGAIAKKMGSKRIVLDGIDVLLTLLNDPVAERRELSRVNSWLKENGMSAIMTAKTRAGADETPEPYGFLPYLSDCVVLMYHRIIEHFSVRGVRIVKYRGSNHAAGEFPLVIYRHGIAVSYLADTKMNTNAMDARMSTGIIRLDTMLSGGYLRGSSVLISGAPGTAKTTLCSAFVEAACKQGEKALFVSFDESAEEIIRNLRSVGIDLASHKDSGLLHFSTVRSKAMGAEEHYIRLYDSLRTHEPSCLVIDSLSALNKSGGQVAALDVTLRLLDYAKLKGITVLCTSLVESADAESEKTAIGISTVADAWMQLAYVNRGGERNRTLTIIKSRGTKHSNQVREMILSNEGIELRDAYSVGGELLLGTARWEREREERQSIERSIHELSDKRRQRASLKEELNNRQLQAEYELHSRCDMLGIEENHIREQLRQQFHYKTDLLIRRGADEELLALINIIDDPAFAHDREFRIVHVNEVYLRVSKMKRDEVIGQLYWDIFPKNHGPMHSCVHAIESGEYEDEIIETDDHQKYRSTHRPVRNREGEYRYSLHVLEPMDEKGIL